MDEKHGRGSMKEDQDRDKERKQTPGRSPQGGRSNTGSRGGSYQNPGSNRPGGGSSSGSQGSGDKKGSHGNPLDEEQESER